MPSDGRERPGLTLMPPKHIRGPPVYKWLAGADGKRRGGKNKGQNARLQSCRELGPEAWRGDKPLPERGVVALGTPIGAPEYVAACARERLEQEQGLLAELTQLPDLQCAWLLLLFCAAPRAQHLLRTVPFFQSAAYAEAHDHAVWGTLQPEARRLAFLPAREGGLGLLRATRAAPAAYWAAWADSLPVMLQRRPDAAERCVWELLVDDEAAAPCLREAAVAGDLLRRHWPERPSWQDSLARAAPPAVVDDSEPGTQLPFSRDRASATHAAERPRLSPLAVWPACGGLRLCRLTRAPRCPCGARARARASFAFLGGRFGTASGGSPQLDAASRSVLFSQAGPFSSPPFTSVPSSPELTFSSCPLACPVVAAFAPPFAFVRAHLPVSSPARPS